MHLNKFWPYPTYASEEINSVDQTHQVPARKQNLSQLALTIPIPCQWEHKMYSIICLPNPSYDTEDKKCIWTCVEKTHPMPARTQNVSQLVLNKAVPCQRGDRVYLNLCWPISRQRGHKMYLNLCWPNITHASEDPKCISTCVDQIPPMPARTQNASQHVLTKPLQCQRGHKMHLNMCWPKLSHVSEDTKYISTCVDQTYQKSARLQIA